MDLLRALSIALPLAAPACPVFAQEAEDPEGALVRTVALPDGSEAAYRLIRPATVEEGETYPLVLFLHGMGERGDDNEAQLRHFPERMLQPEYREAFPCFVVAPQCPDDELWVEVPDQWRRSKPMPAEPSPAMQRAVAAMLDTLRSEPVDKERLYLTGLSMGGFGAWDLATRHANWFAAAAPVCGGGDERAAHRLVGLPVWAWHGSEDRVVPAERSSGMVAALEAAGGAAKLSELDGVGHDSWNAAYALDGVLPWLFEQRRGLGSSRRSAGVTALLSESAHLRADDRIVFLGDSITQSGARPGGYVTVLSDALKHLGRDVAPEVIGAGISGNRVPDLLARLDRDVIERDPTIVFVYIGINDVWHHDNGRGTPIDEYERGLDELLTRIERAGALPILATPSVIGERAPGTNRLDAMLEEFAAVSRAVAAEHDVHVCDLRREFLGLLAVENTDDEASGVLTTDGVHLNAFGNAFVADRAALGIAEALRKARADEDG